MTKAGSLLMTDKECLTIVEDTLRHYFYSAATIEDTKGAIEKEVTQQMLNLRTKDARKVLAMGVYNSSLPLADRKNIVQLIQEIKREGKQRCQPR